ncbi:MAG TPA: symmetrical bis(5'-nucleosyl)-tetraphosphatase [Xanthomonadales bacterium]
MSTYLLGDIQGCYDSLQRLLETIHFDPANDQLWSCGDLVNRGGSSLEVLRLLKSFGPAVNVTLGNHDLHLLASYHRHPNGRSGNPEFDAVFAAPECASLMDWLRSFPLAYWSEEHRVLRVHAGVIPQWDWQATLSAAEEVSAVLQSDQRGEFFKRMYSNKPRLWRDDRTGWKRLRLITNILTRLRFCDELGRGIYSASGPPGSQPEGYQPWFKHSHRKTRDVTVVFGHWAALGLRVKKRYIALDSGCVWGGRLSAVRLEDHTIYQVKCLEK